MDVIVMMIICGRNEDANAVQSADAKMGNGEMENREQRLARASASA